jgi:hypothetical protein
MSSENESGQGRQDAPIETDVEDSNPNADSPDGLAGDMGISSERKGSDTTGIEGTGSVGSSVAGTHGSSETKPEQDKDQNLEDIEEGTDPDSRTEFSTGIDRTVGEDNPAELPSHENDPARNPGHSHG